MSGQVFFLAQDTSKVRVIYSCKHTIPSDSPFVDSIVKKDVGFKIIMEVSQNEQKEDKDSINILAKEIKSWKDFECALREESALLFNKMLSERGQNKGYIRAVSTKGKYYSAESLFIYALNIAAARDD